MADEILKRDSNHVTVLAGITDDANQDIVMLRVDPDTKRLLVTATISSTSVAWGNITGTLSDQTDLQSALDAKQATITFGTNVETALGVNIGSAGSPVLNGGVLGTPSSGTLTNCTFPTLNQNTTGSAASLSISGQSGLLTITGLSSTNRVKTVRDAADTILELGGSYTPTGTWTSLTLVTPVLGTPTSGTLTNCTGLPAASVVAGTLGTGAYVMDTKLTVPQIINTANAIAASSNAATVPVTYKNNIITNDSAATLTITLTTSGAVNMQPVIVQILDFSAVAQTLTWVNTENSTVSVPTTSNGSTTLPLTVGFIYNSATSKFRCVASS